jgi:hypothetical protein
MILQNLLPLIPQGACLFERITTYVVVGLTIAVVLLYSIDTILLIIGPILYKHRKKKHDKEIVLTYSNISLSNYDQLKRFLTRRCRYIDLSKIYAMCRVINVFNEYPGSLDNYCDHCTIYKMEIRTDYSVAEFGGKFVDYRCVFYFRNNLNPKLTYTKEWGTGDTMSLADYIINREFRRDSEFNDRHNKYWVDLT